MNTPKTLILLTSVFPYGNGEVFLEGEILFLADVFDKIIVVSTNVTDMQTRVLPVNVTVIRRKSHMSIWDKLISFYWLFTNDLMEETRIIKNVYAGRLTYYKLKVLVSAILEGKRFKNKIAKLVLKEKKQGNKIYIYSYWFSELAYAAALVKREHPDIISFCRAHNWDVYFERHPEGYLPLRKCISNGLDAVFFIAADGMRYFREKLRLVDAEAKNLRLSRLGVKGASKICEKRAENGFLRLVSCSTAHEVKRMLMIVRSISLLENEEIEWVHFGSGPGQNMEDIKSLADELLGAKSNIKYKFEGWVPNEDVRKYYKENFVDVLINLSSYEGIPVSMMVAMSFGIPVIATAVGGVPELVNDNNGILLKGDTSSGEAADALRKFCRLKEEEVKAYRVNALRTWSENFDADKNYTSFIREVLSLGGEEE